MKTWIAPLLFVAVCLSGCQSHEAGAFDSEVNEPLARAILMQDYDRAASLLEGGHPVEGQSDHKNEPAFWVIFAGDET